MWWMLLFLLILIAVGLWLFISIARKGRELRKTQPLPPPATSAHLEWDVSGEKKRVEVKPPFYLGQNADSEVVLTQARAGFEVCIFYHNQRFAFQSLQGSGEVLINGEEQLAGYLWDGDTMKIADQTFVFRCR